MMPDDLRHARAPDPSPRERIWANLIHLSFNMWSDRDVKPDLPFDMNLWSELLERMAEAGINMVVLDLGDGIHYVSHPEIAVRGAWSPDQLREELARMRSMGLEPVPKLNFSTGHDAWLGPYARCVSTDMYYDVCRDLIAEVIRLFDGPRLFHLGMDEEEFDVQRTHEYVVVRQFDLFWHDIRFLLDRVEEGGARPWVWADMIRRMDPESYLANMPRSVLQSNWYYEDAFTEEVISVRNYRQLEEHGYDQVPTASTVLYPGNLADTVAFARSRIAPERLLGFMQTVWKPTLPEHRASHVEAIKAVAQAMALANA